MAWRTASSYVRRGAGGGRARMSGLQQPDRVLAAAPGHSDELVKDFALLGLGRLSVALAERIEQFSARRFADRGVHRGPPRVEDIPRSQR
jgi:hypothetical protein